jgi:hypothetical protein
MRSGAFDDEPEFDGFTVGEGLERPESMRWRVAPGFRALKIAITVVLLLVGAFFAEDRRALACAVVAAAIAGGYALRDVLAPERLAADPSGLTVISGYAGHRTLTWSQVERVRLESRTRGGLRGQLLEIDSGDYLYLLSRYDLNAPPTDVLDDLERIRSLAPQP